MDTVNGKPALRFLHTPGSKTLSASHTINGHSVVLKLTYGNVRFLCGADLNEEAEERLLQRTGADAISLTARDRRKIVQINKGIIDYGAR